MKGPLLIVLCEKSPYDLIDVVGFLSVILLSFKIVVLISKYQYPVPTNEVFMFNLIARNILRLIRT